MTCMYLGVVWTAGQAQHGASIETEAAWDIKDHLKSMACLHHAEMPLLSISAPNSLTVSSSNSPVGSSGTATGDSIGAGFDAN